MNFKELAKNLELEEDEFLELMALFFKTTISELEKLESVIKEKDALAVQSLAHSMKGGAGSLGLAEIHEAAKRIEGAACENHLEDWEQDIRIIRANLDWIEEALHRGDRNVKA